MKFMLKGVGRMASMIALIALGAAGLFIFKDHFSSQWQIKNLQQEVKEKEAVIQRLSVEDRLAEVIVTDQKEIDGVTHTTLLFVEYTRDGREMLPKVLTIKGKVGHINALVIKFDRDFVKAGDKLRGKSIALFYRAFGDQEAPVDGPRIDQPGKIPEIYQGADPKVSQFEQELWADFWKLAENEKYRREMGVRVAQGEGPWGPFDVGRLYTISLDSDGGLNIRSEVPTGVYREALQRRAGLTTQPAK